MMKTIISLILSALFIIGIYYGWNHPLSIAIGAAWGFINFYFIRKLLYEILIVNPKQYPKIFWLVFLKFPLLYAIGFALLQTDSISPGSCLMGFTLALAAITQKWLWNRFSNIESRQVPS